MSNWVGKSVSSRLQSRRSLMQLGELAARVAAARNWGVGMEPADEPSAPAPRRSLASNRSGPQVMARG